MNQTKKTLTQQLSEIQQKLKAPKGQRNDFGKYQYRSCEDILEGVKPLLGELILTITDRMQMVGERYYIVATARIADADNHIACDGWAREVEERKGMDASQITGSTSSYARKYALNGLLCIDDTADADTHEADKPAKKTASKPAAKVPAKKAVAKKAVAKKDEPITENTFTNLYETIKGWKMTEAKVYNAAMWASKKRTKFVVELYESEGLRLIKQLDDQFSKEGK